MKRRVIDCATCGESFSYSGRGAPKYCEEHRDPKNRRRAVRAAAAKGDPAAKQQAAEMGLITTDGSASEGERFALYLGALGDDVELAAQAAGIGLGLTPKALRAFARDVRKKHRGHYEGRAEVAAQHLQQAQVLLALRIRDSVPDIPVSLLGSTLRQVTDAIQTTTGGGSMIYGDFVVRLNPPSAEDLQAWLEATGADPEMLAASW